MRKIVIFENEFEILRDAFELANLIHFNNELNFDVFETSQDIGEVENVNNYEKILVDIDLSTRSEKDGYTLIREINSIPGHPEIIILTGHSHIEAKLKEYNLSILKILKKPLDVEEIAHALG